MKHSYLTLWLPHPSTPDYADRDREEFTHSRSEPFEKRYPHVSGVILVDNVAGTVREINEYECFYEDGITDQRVLARFMLDALAEGYTMVAPPLVLPNTKPGEHYKNGVTVYFFMEVPPHKLSEQAREAMQRLQSK